jgi:hypothetical protein
MTKAQTPKNNTIFFYIERKFEDGFCSLNVIEAFAEIAYSKAEARRLLTSGGIKIWDTRITEDGNHFEWYKRRAQVVELVEPEDVFIFGKPKALIVKASEGSTFCSWVV